MNPPVEPSENGLTIYIAFNCSTCKKIVTFLNDNNIVNNVIDCSNYFPINLNPLVDFISKHIYSYEDYEIKYNNVILFPMIFNNGKFIGYFDTVDEYINYLKTIIDL